MSNTPHELHEEFPELAAKISEMKTSDAHFSKLAEEYHELNRAVHRAEPTLNPPISSTRKRCAKNARS